MLFLIFENQKLFPTFAPGNFKPFLSIAMLRLKHGIIKNF